MQQTKSTLAGARTHTMHSGKLGNLNAAVLVESKINPDQSITVCVMKCALEKLNECRMKCNGIGGDVDASNLRFMIENGPESKGLEQAVKCLRWISEAVKIDASLEIAAMESVLKNNL